MRTFPRLVLVLALCLASAGLARAGAESAVLDLVRTADGHVRSITVDGRPIYDEAAYQRVTVFERFPDKTVKKVFVGGVRVYEQAWDAKGRPVGTPYMVISPKEDTPEPAETPAALPRGLTVTALRNRILNYVGVPYKAGGEDRATGLNTSGLLWYFYRSLGAQVPRLLQEQADGGQAVDRRSLAVGDALFFDSNGGSKVNIAGIYAGQDEMVYMSYGQKQARLVKIDTPYWTKGWVGARRYLGVTLREPVPTLPTPAVVAGRPAPTPPAKPPTVVQPLPEGVPYQTGMASFYGGGDGFDGSPTASGEIFDDQAMTAAHRTLPFHTMVKVVRPDTGASVTVRINDRGPFVHGRIIDLSHAAAKRLNMVSAGVVKVKLYLAR